MADIVIQSCWRISDISLISRSLFQILLGMPLNCSICHDRHRDARRENFSYSACIWWMMHSTMQQMNNENWLSIVKHSFWFWLWLKVSKPFMGVIAIRFSAQKYVEFKSIWPWSLLLDLNNVTINTLRSFWQVDKGIATLPLVILYNIHSCWDHCSSRISFLTILFKFGLLLPQHT